MKNVLHAAGVAILLVLTMIACEQKPAPPVAAGVAVKAVTVGNAVGADKRVTTPANRFAKTDTIYVAVETGGSGDAALKAKWTFHQGGNMAVVNENTQTLAATGAAVTEFHISNPDGWPLGDYQVEVFLNDKSAGVQKFTIQ